MNKFTLPLLAGLPLALALHAAAVEPRSLLLQTNVQVDSEGVFLNQVAADLSNAALPGVRLAAAPAVGHSLTLTRAQVAGLLERLAPDLASASLVGASNVRVTRRSRPFTESDLTELLTATLQRDLVKDRGTLELRLSRSWSPISLPDESLTLKVLDLPTAGISPNFIVRFELRTAHEALGSWQAAVQAKILREVWVAHTALKRGDALREEDLARERRDMLTLRDSLAELPSGPFVYEIAESLSAGMPLTSRSLKLKPLVHRGQSAEAVVRDGSLSISMKVEVLEEGVPGQLVRARNPQSRREIRGKVLDEQTILVTL
jgi:flagella basal body P-ring formation protein FlgA